jgi:hypothetical protein
MSDLQALVELDLNPVRVAEGGAPVVLDARIRRASPRDRQAS